MVIPFRKKSRKTKSFADVNPIFLLENDKTVFKDGRVAVGFKVHSAEMETWSSGHYHSFNQSIARFMSSLPDDCSIQKTGCYYFAGTEGLDDAKTYFQLMTNRYFGHTLELKQVSYLFITVPPKGVKSRGRIAPFNSLMYMSSQLLGNVFKDIQQTLYTAEEYSNKFINNLDGIGGVQFTRLKKNDLLRLYTQYYNLNFQDSIADNQMSEINVDPSGLQVGHNQLRIVSLHSRGIEIDHSAKNINNVASSYTSDLGLHLQIPHVTTTTLRMENNESRLSSLDKDKFWNESFSVGAFSSQNNSIAQRNLDEFTDTIRDSDARMVTMSLNVMVHSMNTEILRDYVNTTESAIRQIAGSRSVLESCDTLSLFYANVPGNGFNNYRTLLMDNERGAAYLDFQGPVKSHQKGDTLCDRFRNPVKVNFQDRSHLTNQNAIVVGPTGSGKSYTVGEFILQRKERSCRQVIIDVGGTYRNLITMLNGSTFEQTYHEYKGDNTMSFAPFLIPKDREGNYILDDERQDFLLSLLITIWKGANHAHTVKQIEITVLINLIDSFYFDFNRKSTGEIPTFSDFYTFCERCYSREKEDDAFANQLKYFDMKEFLLVLQPFHNGSNKNLLNSREEIDISDHNLVCFDLLGIKSNKTLYPIVSQLIIQLVLNQLDKFPDDDKFLYIDEAWSMLEGSIGEFMQAMFRTIRKLKGSIWIITQNIDDVVSSTHANAILANTDIKIMLRHTDNIRRAAEVLGLTQHGVDLFSSLRKGDVYRDILVKLMDQVRVYTMEVCPEHHIVLSSNPEERNVFMSLLRKHAGNNRMALEEFIATKRRAA